MSAKLCQISPLSSSILFWYRASPGKFQTSDISFFGKFSWYSVVLQSRCSLFISVLYLSVDQISVIAELCFQVGFSSPSQNGIMHDLDLSLSEVYYSIVCCMMQCCCLNQMLCHKLYMWQNLQLIGQI